MSYIEKSLAPDETIVTIFKLHWSAQLPVLVWFLLGVPTLGIGFIVAFIKWLKLKYLEQGVTNRRVIKKDGIVAFKTEEMRLASIETVEISQSFWGRIFGFGNVTATGRGISDVVFLAIDNPMDVKRAIEKADYEHRGDTKSETDTDL